jgi:carboxypeptidase PM20D1
VGQHSLLYQWPGTDTSLRPILLMAHQDVVPIDPVSAQMWTHAPFGGEIAEGFIWGRGTLDDKGAVMALHEAAETLLAQGFRPKRTVYFAFGHDEEVGGRGGSAKIAEWLLSQNLKLESVLDEGQVVTEGIVAGVAKPGRPDRHCRERLPEPRIRRRSRGWSFLDAASAYRGRDIEPGY